MNILRFQVYLRSYAATGSRVKALRAAGAAPVRKRRCSGKISRLSGGCGGKASRGPACQVAGEMPGETAGRGDLDRAMAALESEAVRRALSGVSVPVFHQGRECGSTVKHSDQLLMFLLKALKPERYAGGKEAAQQGERGIRLELDLSAGADAPGADAADGDGLATAAQDAEGQDAEGQYAEGQYAEGRNAMA